MTSVRLILPWDIVNALGLNAGPAGLLNVSSGLGEIVRRNFSCPISLDGLLHLSVGTWGAGLIRTSFDCKTYHPYRYEGNREYWIGPFQKFWGGM